MSRIAHLPQEHTPEEHLMVRSRMLALRLILLCVAVAVVPDLQDARAAGRLETTSFHSPSLEGNAAGDPSTRSARVYLPPSYETSDKHYPVLYLLHGTGANEHEFDDVRIVADRLIQERSIEEFIIVAADGRSKYTVSFYENSELNGDHRDYIAKDLVSHIDTKYRTVADRDSRGVAGHSTGGYGALLLGMKHSDVFGAVYSYSGGGLCFSLPVCITYLGGENTVFSDEVVSLFGDPKAALSNVVRPSQVTGFYGAEMYSMASAFSPNLENPPLLVDMPWESPDLKIVPDVRDRWFEHDLFELLPTHAANLRTLRGLAFDVGDRDELGLHEENVAFHEALLASNVPHEFEVFSGGHGNKLFERVGISLEFFSEALVSEETVLPCDLNIDGFCNGSDLTEETLFQINLAVGSRSDSATATYDLTGDGVVNSEDLAFWLADAATRNGFESVFLAGDADLDGNVDFVDFLAVASNFGRSRRDWERGNFDGDGDVDLSDFLAMSENFGATVAPSAAQQVPEPSGFYLAAIALLVSIGYRTSRHEAEPDRRPLVTSTYIAGGSKPIAQD